ncbi:MAG TPA: MFS transporter [Ktedonobacterales bacterium]|nr:MFS transporter [Ktedonobacterales bacterium]
MTTKLTDPPRQRKGLWSIPAIVYILGAASLFTDIASEMIVPLRLIFLVQVLATPLALAALIEGLAESATSLLKILAGRLADRVASRRGLVSWGYGISAAAKPLLALAPDWLPALGLVLVDRAGKAVRGSPRDAMIADAVPQQRRGLAFGLHRSADTLGAAIGPLVALAILTATNGDVRAVFGWTLVPGALAFAVVLLFVRDPRRRMAPEQATAQQPKDETATQTEAKPGLGARFWLFAAIATCFALGNSSDAFLFLRTEGLESSLAAVPLVYFAFNIIYALLATPLGSLSDRWGRLPVLALGYAAFTLVYLGWTQATATWHVWALFLVYGAYYAATEGVARAFVSDLAPAARRGTALGWFNGLTGAAALPANLAGAWLWGQFGPGATFAMGAWLGAISFGLLLAWWPWLRRSPRPWPEAPQLIQR